MSCPIRNRVSIAVRRIGRSPAAAFPDNSTPAAAADAILGTPGSPVSRRSPFMVGLLGAAGIAVTCAAVQLVVIAANIRGLVGLSLFLASGSRRH
jgi:hypothetical protein